MEYLTVDQAAEYLKVPKSVIYAHWRVMGGVKIGRHVRISREDIDNYMAREGDRQMLQANNLQSEALYNQGRMRPKRKGCRGADPFKEKIAKGEVPVICIPKDLRYLIPREMKIRIAKGEVHPAPRAFVKHCREEIFGQQDDKKNEEGQAKEESGNRDKQGA